MKVNLIQSTDNPVKFITDIASICYGKEESSNPIKLLKHLFEKNHHSTFEHVYFTFEINGISRVTLGQLVRHRHTSPTVESQRYTEQEKKKIVIPETIKKNKKALEVFNKTTNNSKNAYIFLREIGIPKEDARYILPEAIETNKAVSMNLRELILINKLRTSKSAQWEIKEVVKEMVRLVLEKHKELEFMFKVHEDEV